MSVISLSALTSTTVGSSLSSLAPGPEEDTGTPGAAEETEHPSECKLLSLIDGSIYYANSFSSSESQRCWLTFTSFSDHATVKKYIKRKA